jgi:precorrin-2 dehydrogenase/sirohydrochlorin ferrochelatase
VDEGAVKVLPVMIDVKGKNVLIAGGGRIAFRKARTLLNEGARVTVVSPEISFVPEGMEYIRSEYRKEFIKDKLIVIAATDKKTVNRRIADDARNAGILALDASDRKNCDLMFMAYERKNGTVIAVSTEGESPGRARDIRDKLVKENE